ncbi:hypothetical protein VKS41_001066 [Umbelopsis sp. WA50703]
MSRGPGGVYAVPGLVNANGAKECAECQKSFTIFRPKYHCRNCGSVVCANCSEHRNEILKFGYQKYDHLNQYTQRTQPNPSSTTTNSAQAQAQSRPPTTTTSPPPRSSPANGSPDLVEPPSLDTLLQAKIDPSTLSVRTLKAILKANFVEHSKVLEKSELVTRVGRLLDDRKQERQRTDDRGLEDEGLCRICCDASQNCVFLECGHMVTCMECGKKLVASRNECPICRELIVKLVHVFRS